MYKELAQGFIAICCLFLCAGFASAQVTSLSTSNLIPVASVELGGPRINACSGKKLQGGSAYVTITSAKQTVYKKDSRFTQLFNRNRQVFSSYTVSAKYRTEDYSFSQVSEPVSLSGSQSSVDISSNWTLFNRVPWVINSAKLKMRLGYSADSTTDAMASAFSKITGSLPSFTLSTGAAVGLAITDTVDKLLFASDRSRNLLNASFDLPFAGNPLCDGYYAVFAAGDSNLYERYTSQTVVWNGSNLKYNDSSIADVSYAVIRIKIDDKYFPEVRAAFDDYSRPWSLPYTAVLSDIVELAYTNDINVVRLKDSQISRNLAEGRTLLSADRNILSSEQSEIHEYVNTQARSALEIVKKRIAGKTITPEATRETLYEMLAKQSVLVSQTSSAMAINALNSPTSLAPAPAALLAEALKSSIDKIEQVVQ